MRWLQIFWKLGSSQVWHIGDLEVDSRGFHTNSFAIPAPERKRGRGSEGPSGTLRARQFGCQAYDHKSPLNRHTTVVWTYDGFGERVILQGVL